MQFFEVSPAPMVSIQGRCAGCVDVEPEEQHDPGQRPSRVWRDTAKKQEKGERCCTNEAKRHELRRQRVGQQHGEKIKSRTLTVVVVIPDVIRPYSGAVDDGLVEIKI